MGEDRTMCTEKKPNNEVIAPPPCRHRHSSVISSCSEDAESESTSAGYPQSPDEEREEELEYGPGIVNKLRTRYLSITLKQNRGTNMRRSCSMENLLDQDRPSMENTFPVEKSICVNGGCTVQGKPSWGNLKRAKSMDTLLMELHPEPPPVKELRPGVNGDDKKVLKIVKRRDGGLNRLVPTICDEELPKPDTVKTYKRMFEPAESRRGSHCRRPPVLRASARSCAALKTNGVPSSPSAKVNGTTTKSKFSAKQSPPVKAQNPPDYVPSLNGSAKKSLVNGESSRPLYNGCHIVKATPVKINSNNMRNGKDVEKNLNSINRLLNKKEVHFAPKADIICNGNGTHKEILKIKTSDEIGKQLNKNTSMNGSVNSKPKVPPNRPSLKSPKPLLKMDDRKPGDVNISPRLKPNLTSGFKNPSDVEISTHKLKSNLANGLIKPSEVSRKDQPCSLEPKLKDVVQVPQETKPADHINLLPPNKPKEEINLPPENKIKDGIKLLPEDKTKTETKLKNDTKLPTENKVKDIIQTLSESGVKEDKKIHEKDSKPHEKDIEPHEKDIKLHEKDIPETNDRTAPNTPDLIISDKPPKLTPPRVPEKKSPVNGYYEPVIVDRNKSKQDITTDLKCDMKPVKKPLKASPGQTTSMVFDFRGKDVVPHVAVLPVPFGCKSLHPKKRPVLVDGKEVCGGTDDEDEDYVDYSVPPPSGVIFEGENVKIGRGSILSTRNKDLKITFHDDVDANTFIYPSESSLLEDPERPPTPTASTGNEIIPNGQPPPSKLKTNTSIGSSSAGGLSTYTPSVLRTMDNFEPGMFRPPPPPVMPEKEIEEQRKKEEVENTEVREEQEDQDLKPADPDLISSWSLSAGTSDLLF